MDQMKAMWDARYKEPTYAYGQDPNQFFKQAVDDYQLEGNILLAAEGEGRNAIYAAKKGLDAYAFDISEAGKIKAENLAAQNDVTITYEVGNFLELQLANLIYDSAALVYAHFPPSIRSLYQQKISELIRPGGLIILEGFSKNHLKLQKNNPGVGGPKKEDFLLSINEVSSDFHNFEVIQLEEKQVELNEGKYHIGTGSVIRFIGRKK